jgi:hypothetical protein
MGLLAGANWIGGFHHTYFPQGHPRLDLTPGRPRVSVGSQRRTRAVARPQARAKEAQMRKRLIPAAVTATFVMAAAFAAIAMAAAPIKGATYKGKLKLRPGAKVTLAISFKVSTNGKRVGNFKLPNGYPVYCQGGGFGRIQEGSGPISKKGTFKVKLPIYFAPVHLRQGFVIVTGAFAKHGKVAGRVTTDFTSGTACNGSSAYAATG